MTVAAAMAMVVPPTVSMFVIAAIVVVMIIPVCMVIAVVAVFTNARDDNRLASIAVMARPVPVCVVHDEKAWMSFAKSNDLPRRRMMVTVKEGDITEVHVVLIGIDHCRMWMVSPVTVSAPVRRPDALRNVGDG